MPHNDMPKNATRSKATILFAVLVPGLAMLAACNRAPDADDAAKAPVAVTPAPAKTPPPAATPPEPAPPATTNEMSFAELDRNHDGKLTKDELPPSEMLALHFAVADADGNGSLSEAEVSKHRADMAAAPGK